MSKCIATYETAVGKDHPNVAKLKAQKGIKETKTHRAFTADEVRLDMVTNELIGQAVTDYQQLIADVQVAWPELINNRGEFLRDLRLTQPQEGEQLELFEAAPKATPKKKLAKPKEKAKEKKDGVRDKEKETKAGSKEPSPAKVLRKGKAKGPKPTPKGKAKLTAAAAKDKAKASKGQQAARPKAPEEKSKPAREEEPEQAEQKRAEPVSSGVAAPAVAATTQVAPIEASPEIVTIVDTIETAVGQEKADAIVDLLSAALADEATGLIEDTSGALDLANREDLLWGPADRELTIAAFIEVLQSLYADKKNVTFAHQQAMWDFAIQHDMFRDAYIAVTSGGQGIAGFTPTKPKAVMIAKLNKLGIADVLINHSREATDGLVRLLSKFIGFEEDIHFSGHTVNALKDANAKIAVLIKTGADLSTDFVPGVKISEMLKNGKIAWLPFEGSKTLKTIAKPESYETADVIVSDMEGRNKIFDTNGKPITKPIPLGIAKPIVARMMNLFNAAVRPKHRVYKNLAELQRKDPKLYAEANASRKDGSTIPDTAAGYAFKNRILIFTDNIANKQQLTFTILHEVVGHFGLGSLMSTKNFRTLMDDIYRADPAIRRDADALRKIRSKDAKNKLQKGKALGHYEAIEEALADRAAELNNSIVQKVWNAIRKVLNAMGFRFHDDMTRFFIDQSLRYQRTGMLPDASAPAVYQHLKVLSERSLEGRASVPNTPEQQASNTTFHSEVKAKQKSVKPLGRSPGEKLDAFIKRVANREGAKAQVIGAWGDIKKALENIQPMNNIAQFSAGIHRLYQAFVGQAQELSHLKTKYINATEYVHRVNSKFLKTLGLQEGDAPSAADREQAARALEMHTMARKEGMTEEELKKLPSLTEKDANGNEVLFYGLDENGKPIKDKDGNLRGIAAVRAVGAMTRKEIDAGIEIPTMDNDGKPAFKADGTPDTELFKLDKPLSDNAWRIVEDTRNVIDQGSLDAHINNINGILQHQDYIKGKMSEDNENLTEADLVIIDEILAVYRRLFDHKATLEGKGMKWNAESKERAKRWLHNTLRVLDTAEGVSKQKLADWRGEYVAGTQDEKNMEEFRTSTDKDIQLVLSKINDLGANRENGGIKSDEIKITIQNIHALNGNLTNSEFYAKDSIAKAYVPFIRPGKYQVRVQAYDSKGSPIRLSDDLQAGLIYARHDDIAEVKRYTTALTDALAGSKVDGILDSKGNVQHGVTYRGVYEVALDSAPLAGNVNYAEIFSTLLRAGIDLNAVDRQKLVELTAAQYSTARHNLRKQLVPGWDQDIHRGVREHLERQANIAAKNLYQHRISDTLVDKKIWHGDAVKHKKLQTAFVAALVTGNEAKIFRAKQDMDRYQLQFEHAVPVGSDIIRMSLNKDGTLKEELVNGRGLGNHYLNKAIGMVSQYTAAHGMPAVTGDQKIGQASGVFMTVGTAAQLGGAIAPAAINTTSLITHAVPFLATYNPKTGFGFGHGMPAALQAIVQAGRDLSLFKDGRLDATGSSKAIRAIIEEEKRNPGSMMAKYGITMDEAEMLYDHTDKGAMTANITNVLTGANTFLKGTGKAKAIETWMFLFTKTEQFNRRVTGLAAYRLERDRMLKAEGITVEQLTAEQKKELANRVDEAIDFSQGNYEKFNHPSAAQGPILKYLWVYKQFQAITIILMRHLGHKERAAFLAFFILTAGLKGIPFEEDFADLIDTLMQTFGIDWNGLDAEMVSLFTSLGLPAGLMMRGPIDYYVGITYSTRISQSNIVPGSGFLKAGADPWREAKDIIGPVFNAWSGIFGATGVIGQYALETVGLRDDVTSGRDVLREGLGLSALRNYARGITYFIDGTITNDRGQVVSHDAGVMTALFQMMGFYPSTATRQYDVNRINSDVTAYSKQMIQGYVDAYIKADKAGRRNIKRQVREWNKDVGRRSPLYITDFSGKVSRGGKSARQSSVERSLKALPKASKRFGKDIAKRFGLSPKGLEIGR